MNLMMKSKDVTKSRTDNDEYVIESYSTCTELLGNPSESSCSCNFVSEPEIENTAKTRSRPTSPVTDETFE